MKLGEMQRYYLWQDVPNRNEHRAEMCEADNGDYVLFSDASAQLSEAQRRVEELEKALWRLYIANKSPAAFTDLGPAISSAETVLSMEMK